MSLAEEKEVARMVASLVTITNPTLRERLSESEQRSAVCLEALTWVGTPFLFAACTKGLGVDCARFPAAVFNSVGVKNIDQQSLPLDAPKAVKALEVAETANEEESSNACS
ncbi:MAG: hypothetical protein ACM3JB_07235 [Acidobacteriaceae bacterium]